MFDTDTIDLSKALFALGSSCPLLSSHAYAYIGDSFFASKSIRLLIDISHFIVWIKSFGPRNIVSLQGVLVYVQVA
jgi:hypothetical protein